MSRRFVAAAVAGVVLLGAAWMFRYDIRTDPNGPAVLLDRWTGSIQHCFRERCVPIGR